jgi:site-specific DNA-methyltransferase (adenine-specific)
MSDSIERDAQGLPTRLLLGLGDLGPRIDEERARQCWATPRRLFAALHREFRFTIDACALAHNAKLERFWTPEQDGLAQDWTGERVWCNPPYDFIEPWVEKAYHHGEAGGFSALLLPVRTDRDWWHRYVLSAGCVDYFRGRVSFEPPPGIRPSSNREPSALILFGVAGCGAGSRDAVTGEVIICEPHAEQLTLAVRTEGK